MARAIQTCRDYIAGETLALDVCPEKLERSLAEGEVDIDGEKIAVTLAKA